MILERIYMNDENEMPEDIVSSLASAVNEELGENSSESDDSVKEAPKKKHKFLALKIIIIVLCCVVGAGAFLAFTPPGRRILVGFATQYMYGNMKKVAPSPVKVATGSAVSESAVAESATEKAIEAGESTTVVDNIDMSQMSDTFKNAFHEEGVYNIVLLGVEGIGADTASGHTDSIMIATINTNNKTLGLTSLMRDSYVEIPGFGGNKINAAFRDGGVNLLYETIAANYGIRMDGSLLVDFNAFESVIDSIGGVDIELTETEANYLNHTNYISKKANRTMVTGWNHMNGNQALGYCRVRYVSTLDGSHDDMGRTTRHRTVINAIFKKAKSDPTKALSAFNTVLPYLTTDIKQDNMTAYIAAGLELMLAGKELRQDRLPQDEAMTLGRVDGKSVVLVDWSLVKPEMMSFMFGTETASNASESAINKN